MTNRTTNEFLNAIGTESEELVDSAYSDEELSTKNLIEKMDQGWPQFLFGMIIGYALTGLGIVIVVVSLFFML